VNPYGPTVFFPSSNFVVADTVELSIDDYPDPDDRRYQMKVWCVANCGARFAKRHTPTPDTVKFDFESEEDAMLFRIRWM
jgi:hypothetical protein